MVFARKCELKQAGDTAVNQQRYGPEPGKARAKRRIEDEAIRRLAPFNQTGFGETRQNSPPERHRLRAVKQQQSAILGVAKSHQRAEEAVHQVIDVLGLQLGVKQSVESLGFSLSHLIIGIVERQNDAELQLLASPAEILVFVRMRQNQDGIEHAVVLP